MQCKVYDETVLVLVVRNNERLEIPFCEIKEGDHVYNGEEFYFIAGEDAHFSGDSSYEGYLVHDNSPSGGGGYFPEDFGAELVYDPDEDDDDDEEDTTEEAGICPVCGAELEYVDSHEIVDDSVKVDWVCPECDAEGTEWYDIVFSHHENLLKEDDSPFTEEELEGKDMECGEICPICGGAIEFHGDQHIVEGECTVVTWHCTQCGTQGDEVSDLVFSEHLYDECDDDDEDFDDEEET